MRIRATGLVVSKGAILLVREHSGMWLLPGGSIERNELAIVAAIRALHEITGIEAHAAASLFEHVSAHHIHHVFRIAVSDNARPRTDARFSAVQWVAPQELYRRQITPGTEAILARALAESSSLRRHEVAATV
ncbi:NUDIX domain-containing protein [Caballeronia humi]|uniref:NUDIX hydrolase n=1 Tax=Caballeronia humi TaxID=326474 RepID=A0A158G0A9_9BURK|nr:NUDIX domain-containing protein [Caballeronia humi]SAL25317.1 NUDIX hydrolase [Caballeronia humi]